MIPQEEIKHWAKFVPWESSAKVEQDLILSRAIIDIFSDRFLKENLRIRGGTALNKLHFQTPIRYSEDIDLVRTTAGPIKPIIRQLRQVLEPWLGTGSFQSSRITPKLRFRVPAEEEQAEDIRIKIEINTNEIESYDPPWTVQFVVEGRWGGRANVETFSPEEMVATKLRALLQRRKGRDLFDVDHALNIFEDLDTPKVIACLAFYLDRWGKPISRAEAERRILSKLAYDDFLIDVRPLLSTAEARQLTPETAKVAVGNILSRLIALMPGKPWANFSDTVESFGISNYLEG